MLNLVKTIEQVSEIKMKYNVVEYPDSYPADEPLRRAPDIRKAQLQLDYKPEVDLTSGLSAFLKWSDSVYVGEV